MTTSLKTFAAVSAVALAAITTSAPAQARHFGPGLAGGLIAGALIAGAASSAYAYAPGPGYYAYDDYAPAPYYGHRGHPYRTYGVYDESQHGGQPSYVRPYD